jgi:hypothetical protein
MIASMMQNNWLNSKQAAFPGGVKFYQKLGRPASCSSIIKLTIFLFLGSRPHFLLDVTEKIMERFQVPLDVACYAMDPQRLEQAFAFQWLASISQLIQAVGDVLDEMTNVRNLNCNVLGGISNAFFLRRYELPCAGTSEKESTCIPYVITCA